MTLAYEPRYLISLENTPRYIRFSPVRSGHDTGCFVGGAEGRGIAAAAAGRRRASAQEERGEVSPCVARRCVRASGGRVAACMKQRRVSLGALPRASGAALAQSIASSMA